MLLSIILTSIAGYILIIFMVYSYYIILFSKGRYLTLFCPMGSGVCRDKWIMTSGGSSVCTSCSLNNNCSEQTTGNTYRCVDFEFKNCNDCIDYIRSVDSYNTPNNLSRENITRAKSIDFKLKIFSIFWIFTVSFYSILFLIVGIGVVIYKFSYMTMDFFLGLFLDTLEVKHALMLIAYAVDIIIAFLIISRFINGMNGEYLEMASLCITFILVIPFSYLILKDMHRGKEKNEVE